MAYDKNNMGKELGWDAEISDEGGEFVIIPAGDYGFTVESFQRKRFPGSEKMCPCNQVTLELRIDCPERITVEDNLFLNRKTEWKVSQFLLAIGWKKPGEPVRPKWDALPGTRGRCKIKVDKWKGRDWNKVEKYYPAENPAGMPAQTATAYQQQPQPYQQQWNAYQQQSAPAPAQQYQQPVAGQQTMNGWASGKF